MHVRHVRGRRVERRSRFGRGLVGIVVRLRGFGRLTCGFVRRELEHRGRGTAAFGGARVTGRRRFVRGRRAALRGRLVRRVAASAARRVVFVFLVVFGLVVFAHAERFAFGFRHRCDERVGERAESAVERELHLGLGPAVRDEEIFELEAIHAALDRFDGPGGNARLFLEQAEHRAAAAIEFLELRAPALDAPEETLRHVADGPAPEAADERRREPRVDQIERTLHVIGSGGEFTREAFEDRCGGHGTSPDTS